MKKSPALFLLALCLSVAFRAPAQPAVYTAANAHSHNDYEQQQPFFQAYTSRFGSIEADLFLKNDSLFVAHHVGDIAPSRTFGALYLAPLAQIAAGNKGRIYEDRDLQLLIDLKTEAYSTLEALVKTLEPHAEILYPAGSVRIVISGNIPRSSDFEKFPAYIFFDGRPETRYTASEMTRIGLISQSFTRFSFWKGGSSFPEEDRTTLKAMVKAVHDSGKKIRFWATPDTQTAWTLLQDLGVDYINTDRIEALAAFLQSK